MTTAKKKEHTEAIADAIIQVLADPRADKIRDHMRAILNRAETVEEMQDLQEGRSDRFLSDTCAEVADEVIETHVEDMETEASEIASHILSKLGTLEMRRGLLESEEAPWA